jgi:hypothetical protein
VCIGDAISKCDGFGRANIISDRAEKKLCPNHIMSHYGGRMCRFSDDDIRNVNVIRIDIDSMTGKKYD